MSFWNPIALWGLLAISIPIILHFWNGKRGKTIAWAAMDFLQISENRVSKGVKLENLLVLLLRVLMIVLLVMIAAKAFWDANSATARLEIAHVLPAQKALLEEFRFEIQQALEQDELVYLASDPPERIESAASLFEWEGVASQNLQATLDQLPVDLDSLIIYLPNSNLSDDFYLVSLRPSFQISDQERTFGGSSFRSSDGAVFKVADTGFLERQKMNTTQDVSFDFFDKSILVSMKMGEEEKRTVSAALASISEVYGLSFQETNTLDSAQIIFSNRQIQNPDPKKLYLISGYSGYSVQQNERFFPDSFTFAASEQVRQGQFPELILEAYLLFRGIERKPSDLDVTSLEQRFLVRKKSDIEEAKASEMWWILLLVSLILERYLALKQGV